MQENNPLKIILQLTQHGSALEVRADSLSGQVRSETDAPLTELLYEFEPESTSPTGAAHSKIGCSLYNTIFCGDIKHLLFDILDKGRSIKKPIHIEIRFDHDQVALARFPWELIKNDIDQYLLRDGIAHLTRCVTYPQQMPNFNSNTKDSSLLRVISSPISLPPISTIDLPISNVFTLAHATFSDFQKTLLIDQINSWGFQFDGHGALLLKCNNCSTTNMITSMVCKNCHIDLSNATQIGVLAFENNGEPDFVTTEQVGTVLYNSQIQVSLLLACESAMVGDQHIFNGLAARLILCGVPAVIGMQYSVLDTFANNFAKFFYKEYKKSGNLLDSISLARRCTCRETWFIPSLYLRYKPSIDESLESIFKMRQIDTVTPEFVKAGSPFLVRLWIRLPTTEPLSNEELKRQIGLPPDSQIATNIVEADIRFDRIPGFKLKKGDVAVTLHADGCEIKPNTIRVFVDENKDAPPAIFSVIVKKIGKTPLVFSLLQDDHLIASIIHHVNSVETLTKAENTVKQSTSDVSIEEETIRFAIRRQLSVEMEELEQKRDLFQMLKQIDKLEHFNTFLDHEYSQRSKGLAFVLHAFQACPMITETSIEGQIHHFCRCGQCMHYIRQNPFELSLHPFLEGFLSFSNERQYIISSDLLPLDELSRIPFGRQERLERRFDRFRLVAFERFIHIEGKRLYQVFNEYLKEVEPKLVKEYLEFKLTYIQKQ